MTFVRRLGLAVAQPRSALELAGDRQWAGRSGSDLLLAIGILLLATQLRWLISAVWLGIEVDKHLGLHAIVHVLTTTLTLELALLVVGAGIIYVASGPGRELGRSFDFSCVTVLPLVFVQLLAQTIVSIGNVPLPHRVLLAIDGVAFAWMAGLVAIALGVARRAAAPIEPANTQSRRAGWAFVTVALAGIAVQSLWIVQHPDAVHPLEPGGIAPAFALKKIGPGGALGAPVSATPGRITVVDFWATWCGPCLRSMPRLDKYARAHPEIDVLTINLDDPAGARDIFDKAQYALALLADDGEVSERFGVVTIPHTVVIDRAGRSVQVDGSELEARIRALQ